jgi:hypothetical protein
MWLFTQDGFISAVAHRDKIGVILVRARDRQSLDSLIDYCGSPDLPNEIHHTPRADYPYRLEIDRSQFARWLVDQTYEIDYDNFKSRVHHTRGDDFELPLHQVWSIMHSVEDIDARPPRRAKTTAV